MQVRIQHDHTVTAGGDETILMISQFSEPAESISLSKCPVFPMNVLFFNFFTCSVSDMNLNTFKGRLHGAEGPQKSVVDFARVVGAHGGGRFLLWRTRGRGWITLAAALRLTQG